MNPDSTRKAIRRSILKQEGKTRVEVVLDRATALDLETIRDRTGAKDNAAAVRIAIFMAADCLAARTAIGTVSVGTKPKAK